MKALKFILILFCFFAWGKNPDSTLLFKDQHLKENTVERVEAFQEEKSKSMTEKNSADEERKNERIGESSPPLESVLLDSDSIKTLDTVKKTDPVISQSKNSSIANKRTVKDPKKVLYLGGGEHSPWFHLGVLYAIEEYQIPIDSIVATSWGAWVAALWVSGFSPDQIQSLFLEEDLKDFVGKEQGSNDSKDFIPFLPIAKKGLPTLQWRYSIEGDSLGKLKVQRQILGRESLEYQRNWFEFRIQESLSRKPIHPNKAFLSISPEFSTGKNLKTIYQSLPLRGHRHSGEWASLVLIPSITDSLELSIVSTPIPIRYTDTVTNPWKRTIWKQSLESLEDLPKNVILLRPHRISENTREAYIQAGFTAFEKKLGVIAKNLTKKSSLRSTDSIIPWFQFKPSYDALSAEIQAQIKTHWNPKDTGIEAPKNFLKSLYESGLYQDIKLELQENGELYVDAKTPSILDIYLGGFGSNIRGVNAYSKIDMQYINQFEYLFLLDAFYGLNSYGVRPEIRLSRLLDGKGSFFINVDYTKIEVLKNYLQNEFLWNALLVESKKDFNTGFVYQVSDWTRLDFRVSFASREHQFYYGKEILNIKSKPVEPFFSYEYSTPNFEEWFGGDGYRIKASLSMRSIYAGIYDFVPMHYRSQVNFEFKHSPTPFLNLGLAAIGALSLYHKEGYGYVYPELLGYNPIDNVYRFQIPASPWSTEWYFAELSSYHYALLRTQIGLHKHYFGFWVFASYIKDFEENPSVFIRDHRFLLEPTLRFAYNSLDVRVGLSRLVDHQNILQLRKFKAYRYFIQIGNYQF